MHPGGVCAMPRHGVVMLGLLQRAMLHVKNTRESSSLGYHYVVTLFATLINKCSPPYVHTHSHTHYT